MLTLILIIDIIGALLPLAVLIVGMREIDSRQKSIQKAMICNAQNQKEQ